MRLFRLELKRILKSRRTLILLAIALLLSVAMAYLPISFEGINRPNEDGTVTELDGLAAIKYKQDLYKTSAGEVTPDTALILHASVRIGSNRLWKLIKAAFENMGQSRKRAFLWLYLLKKSSRSVTC